MAKFDDTVNKAVNGVDTYVTKLFDPNGIELSGGEGQRLALSRTFYRKCPILILDEPSSSLDPKAEKQIFNKLKIVGRDKIIIFTSHNLANLSLADKIVVLEKGHIIQQGTRDILMTQEGRFSELFGYQDGSTICQNDEVRRKSDATKTTR